MLLLLLQQPGQRTVPKCRVLWLPDSRQRRDIPSTRHHTCYPVLPESKLNTRPQRLTCKAHYITCILPCLTSSSTKVVLLPIQMSLPVKQVQPLASQALLLNAQLGSLLLSASSHPCLQTAPEVPWGPQVPINHHSENHNWRHSLHTYV